MGGVRSFDAWAVGSEEVCYSQPGWIVARFRGPVCRRSTQSMTKNPADSADKTDLVSADSNFRGLIHRIGDRLWADRLATSVTPRHCLGVLGIRCRGKGKWRFGKHRRTSRHPLLLVFLHRATTCPGRTKRDRAQTVRRNTTCARNPDRGRDSEPPATCNITAGPSRHGPIGIEVSASISGARNRRVPSIQPGRGQCPRTARTNCRMR